LPILKDQRELLKSLVEEKVASQKQYDEVLKRLDRLTVDRDDASLSSLSKETTRTTNSSITLVSTTPSLFDAPVAPDNDALLPSLPPHLHHRADEIFDHCRLIKAVIEEVNQARYKIDLGIRYRTQEGILDSHYNEWVHHMVSVGDRTSQQNSHGRYDFLEKCPQLVSSPLPGDTCPSPLKVPQKQHWVRKDAQKESMLSQQTRLQQRQAALEQQRFFQGPVIHPQRSPATGFHPPVGTVDEKRSSPTYKHSSGPIMANASMGSSSPERYMYLAKQDQTFPWRGGNRDLQDYQMQVMLLEAQNKKRLMMARQEPDQASAFGSGIPPLQQEAQTTRFGG
jgi:hypothetical protein